MIKYERVNELLKYDQETGVLTWRVSRGRVSAGGVAGSPDKDGYIRVRIEGSLYGAHRIAWMLTHRAWPDNDIDHVNHDTADNRIVNLRPATRVENTRNARSANPLGKGVYNCRRGFYARIKYRGKQHYLGRFETPEEAAAAYAAAAAIHHGKFACTEQAEAGA